MKTKFKRIGKQSLSVILAVMMMVSTMLVGMVTSNAADTFTSGTTLYLKVSAIAVGNERWAAYFYNSSTDFAWEDMTQVTGDTNYYKVKVPNSYATVIFCRMKGDTTENNWDNKWNQTEDLSATGAGSNNCYEISGWGTDKLAGSWSNYSGGSTTTYNVTVKYTAAEVSSITHKDQPVSNDEVISVNSGDSFALSVKAAEGYSVTSVTTDGGTTLTESNGTYTLDAVTADTTITVNTTSSSSGGEGTATTYKLMVSRSSDGLAAVKDTTVYQLGENSYYVIVPANTFKKGNNFFALSSDGNKTGILSYSGSSRDDTISADVEQIGRQENGGKEFVFVSFEKDIDYAVKITYNSGKYTISRADASVTTHEVKLTSDSSANATVKVTSGSTTTTLSSTTVANVAENSTYTLSVAPLSGHKITGIFVGGLPISDAITKPYGENSFTKEMGTANVEVRVTTEVAPSYNITTVFESTQGSVTVSPTSCKAGETFTVTVNPTTNYAVDNVVAKYGTSTLDPTTTSGNTYTYTMPASDVTVSATFKEKEVTKYSVTYTAPTGEGVASERINPTDATLAAGTPVTVTVEVEDGYKASLDVDGVNVTTSKSGNTYTFTFTMPEKAITVAPEVTKAGENTGTEIQGLYLIYTTENDGKPTNFKQYLNLYYDSNYQVYAYLNEDTKFNTSKTYKFMISTLTGENSYRGTTNYNKDNSKVNVTTTDGNNIVVGASEYGVTENNVYSKYYYGWFSVKEESRDTISSVKINLGYYKDGKIQESAEDASYAYTYEVIPTNSGAVEGMPQVFAKDGTIRADFQKYADMADTVLTAENTSDLTKYVQKDYYDTAYAKVGSKLKITTIILPEYRDKYFVKAFSINGYSYGIINASQADTTYGKYTCEYTIPEDFKGSRIEITPIYYYIDDTDTVTFYVEGFDETVQDMWGNTVAVQAWYTNGEEKDKFDSLTKNALGGYPGQPLVYEGGKYSMQIPKYLNGTKANTVSGITLNNYFWDDIHKKNFSDTSDKSVYNCQTYDYDDFYKLSETADVDNIIFDFRYRTTTDNKPSEDGLTPSDYNPTELEPLKDYYGNIVDIFGTILSKDWKVDYNSNYLTVISDGYKNNENIGKYATEWSVYDNAGTYITTINCSSLIDETKVDSNYQEAYNKLKQQYAGLPVKIAYEMSKFDGDDKGTRADGRWYFSKKAQKISANVKIEYRADDTSAFVEDTFAEGSNVGVNTKAQAYFTNAGYSDKTTCQGTVDGGNFSVHAQTDADAKYYFIGWYLKTSDGYSFITNESDADFPMTNNETYVARFINTPSGTLTLSHTLLDGSAYGKTYIKADIIDSANNVKASIDETSGNLVIPSKYVTYTSPYIIRLTLRTVPYGNDTVEGFYEGFSSDKPVRYNKDFTDTGEQTYIVTHDITSLFVGSTDADGNTSYILKKSNIPFYSNITSQPLDYEITYTYTTRLDGKQSYVIKDKVSGIELEEMWAANVAAGDSDVNKYHLSKAFITKKAPFVSNFREEIRWNMDEATISDYTATVSANTRTVDLEISALTVAGQWTQPATVKYGELAMSNGKYLYKTDTTEFPSKFNGYDFSFWAIFDNKDEAQKYSNEVVKYMSDKPDVNMSQRLTDLTTRDGYKNLISKSYSKEYNYVSYQDYYIVPVYAGRFAKDQINESQASIRLLEYTRNQWTNDKGVNGNGVAHDPNGKTDYLYTDFALSFDKDQELIKYNTNIKVGIAFEIVAKYDAVKDDLKSFETPSDTTAIGDKVMAATDNGKVGTYEMNGASRSIYRYEINNSDISVKNRIEYYLQFKNNNKAQQNVMKVYSYIYDTQSDNICLSEPVYMNMYDIGNLTYITSDLANINLGPDATV